MLPVGFPWVTMSATSFILCCTAGNATIGIHYSLMVNIGNDSVVPPSGRNTPAPEHIVTKKAVTTGPTRLPLLARIPQPALPLLSPAALHNPASAACDSF
jgi:hypothetical protein